MENSNLTNFLNFSILPEDDILAKGYTLAVVGIVVDKQPALVVSSNNLVTCL